MKLIRIPRNNEVRNEIPAALTDNMSISAEAKILWIKLYNSNRGKGDYKKFTPTTQGLATLFKVTKRSIINWMNELRDNGWIHTTGERNCTTLFINYTPALVKNNSPALVKKIAPITIKDAFAPSGGENASTIITTNFEETGEENDTSFELGINNDN